MTSPLPHTHPAIHPMISLTKGITSKGIVRPKVLLDQRYRWFLTKSELSAVPSQAARRRFYLRGPFGSVRRSCASAPARWLSRHAHSNLKHHPSVTGGGWTRPLQVTVPLGSVFCLLWAPQPCPSLEMSPLGRVQGRHRWFVLSCAPHKAHQHPKLVMCGRNPHVMNT